jgi:ubiquinone/menaquinone biosynthesis C-methylase UbiE
MTYASFDASERIPVTAEDFREVEKRLLDGNPWLRDEFDFAALSGQRVLEIGCGSGSASCLLARAGAQVSAIDLTQQAVTLTRKNASVQGLDFDVRQMDAERLEFPANHFDFVFTWGVIHHSQETERIIAEIQRVLRPGGRGMCMVYNKHSLRYYVLGLYYLLVKGKLLRGYDLDSVQGLFTDGFYQRHFTPRELAAAFRSAGLAPTAVHKTHMAGPILPGVPAALDRPLKQRFGWLLVIEFAKPA